MANLSLVFKAVDEASASIRRVEGSLGSLDKSTNSLSGSLKRMGEIAGGVLLAQLGGQVLNSIKGAAGAITDFSSQTEQAAIAFDVMTGSAEAGATVLRDLEKFALTTPFDFPDVLELSKRLLAMGTSTADLIPTMTMLGNVAAGVGKEKLPQLILAFGQVQAAGRLTGAELRQFTEASAFGLTDLAKHLGVTTARAKEMVEEGKVGFKDVRDLLAGMSAEGGKFNNLMGRLAGTFEGAMANIRDALRFASRDMFAPLFKQLSEWAQAISAFLQSADFKAWAKEAGESIAQFARMLGQATTILFNFAIWVSENQALLMALKGAALLVAGAFLFMAAPMIGAAVLIGTVIAAVAVLIDHFSLFEQAANIIGIQAGKIAQILVNTFGGALGWLAERTAVATQFMIDRFRTLAQAVAIIGKALGQDVSGLVGFINTIPTNIRASFDGIPNFLGGVGEAVGGLIGGIAEKAKTGFDSITAGVPGMIERLTRPIKLVGSSVDQAGIKFADGPDSLAGKAEKAGSAVGKAADDGAKAMKELAEEAEKAAKALEDAIVKRAEAMGKALMNALGPGAGSTFDLIKQGFADFAKGEWLATLEADIERVSRQINEALAAGLDPTEIIQGAMPLFEAYRQAVDKTAEAVRAAMESLAQKAMEIGERIGAEGVKAAENQLARFADFRQRLQAEQEGISKTWLDNLRQESVESVRIATEAMQALIAEGRRAALQADADERAATARRDARIEQERQKSIQQGRESAEQEQGVAFFGARLSPSELARTIEAWIQSGTATAGHGATPGDALQKLIDRIREGMGQNTDSDPGFALGGVVPGPRGAPMRAIVHGGETIIPAGKGGGGNITVNVYVSGSIQSESDLKQTILEAITDSRRRGGLALA